MTDLGDADLFCELDPKEIQALRDIAQERTFPAGARIFSENDPGDGVLSSAKAWLKSPTSPATARIVCFRSLAPATFSGKWL